MATKDSLENNNSNTSNRGLIANSGESPDTPRSLPFQESQRRKALYEISAYRTDIVAAAKAYNVSPTAIAGAILWEGNENSRIGKSKIPGTIHIDVAQRFAKEKINGKYLVPAEYRNLTDGQLEAKLKQPKHAIVFIAAVMNSHADKYERIAKVNIRNNPGVLATLYQKGNAEASANSLRQKRKTDPNAQPTANDEMGAYTNENANYLKNMLNGTYRYDEKGNRQIIDIDGKSRQSSTSTTSEKASAVTHTDGDATQATNNIKENDAKKLSAEQQAAVATFTKTTNDSLKSGQKFGKETVAVALAAIDKQTPGFVKQNPDFVKGMIAKAAKDLQKTAPTAKTSTQRVTRS